MSTYNRYVHFPHQDSHLKTHPQAPDPRTAARLAPQEAAGVPRHTAEHAPRGRPTPMGSLYACLGEGEEDRLEIAFRTVSGRERSGVQIYLGGVLHAVSDSVNVV